MRRRLALWAELLRLSWRSAPGLTAGALAAICGSVVVAAAIALSLRLMVNSSIGGVRGRAVLGALGVALAYTVSMIVRDTMTNLVGTVTDQVARLRLHPRIHLDIATIDGLDHLERVDYLDRVTVVRGAAGSLMRGMWNAVLAVASVAQLGLAVALLGSVSPWLLFLLVFAAVPVYCDQRGQRAVKRAEVGTAETYRLQQQLFDLAVHADSGKELRVSGVSAEVVRRQRLGWDEVTRARYRARVRAAAWSLLGWLVFSLAFVGALALLVHRVADGYGTVGDLVFAVSMAVSLRQTLQVAVASTTETAASGRVVDPYLWLREYAESHRHAVGCGGGTPDVLRHGITFEGVSYGYPDSGRLAVDQVSVQLPAGAVVAVVGEYGSGKTTLVKLLCRFYEPCSGRILVDGTDLSTLDTTGWRSRCSAVFQDFGRFRTRFAEVVGLGDLPHLDDAERVTAAVHAAGADDLLARLPDGLATQLGRELGGVELSEGQWQRTALARAAMRPGPLLFMLDEPTASLDAPTEQKIFARHMTRAREVSSRTGAVTVVVSHRFSTVTGADLILVMHAGRLVELGRHAELLALGGRYADLYGVQADAYAQA